jgi:hypothetical protein
MFVTYIQIRFRYVHFAKHPLRATEGIGQELLRLGECAVLHGKWPMLDRYVDISPYPKTPQEVQEF